MKIQILEHKENNKEERKERKDRRKNQNDESLSITYDTCLTLPWKRGRKQGSEEQMMSDYMSKHLL